ncbi:MAG: hypothetical protein WBF33_18050, partial [Candidatus Nitrosopolaris sp.]
WNDTSREVHEMFKTTAIDTLKQDKKCQACWYMILSTMSGSTTLTHVRTCHVHSLTHVTHACSHVHCLCHSESSILYAKFV